jgi:hypothetical protein
MKLKLFICAILCQHQISQCIAQHNHFTHSIEASIVGTIKPSIALRKVPSPNNPGIDYLFPIFKGYKYPTSMFLYRLGYNTKNGYKFNCSVATILRYMEPFNGSNQTYYSFPLRMGLEHNMIKTKHFIYSFEVDAGYNFKHPKYKYTDGIGGWIGGLNIRKQHKTKSHYLKLGIDYIQERGLIFWKYSQFLPNGIDETMRFNSHLVQVSFGFGIYIKS